MQNKTLVLSEWLNGLFLIAMFFFIGYGCASAPNPKPVSDHTPQYPRRSDVRLNFEWEGVPGEFEEFIDELGVMNQEERTRSRVDPTTEELLKSLEKSKQVTTDSLEVVTDNYQVQVGAYRDKRTAELTAQEAREKFPDLAVQVVYSSPYWKVRMGNMQNRFQAERLKTKARAVGYRDAWVVKVE